MDLVGIDLGTTNSLVAIKGEALPLNCEHGAATLPSVVAFPPNGNTLVGTAARRRRAIDGKNTVWSAKRLIGRQWIAPEVAEMRKRYPFDLIKNDQEEPAFRTRAGVLTPVDIGSTVLRRLLEEAALTSGVSRAVIGVPSGFRDAHRQATVKAARQAGLTEVMVIDEPVATVLAYSAGGKDAMGRVAVYDLGGGTFELAVVDCRDQPFRVLANRGDLYLGGDDIDQSIAEWVASEVLDQQRWDLRDNRLVFDRLVVECERAKMRLCYTSETKVELSQVDPAVPGGSGTVTLSQERLQALCDSLVRRTFIICDEVLAIAGLKVSELDAVFLAGGSTQLPMVRDAVAQYFGKAPRCEFDPMEVVGIGASLAPASLFRA